MSVGGGGGLFVITSVVSVYIWLSLIPEWSASSRRLICFVSLQLEFTPEQIEGTFQDCYYSWHLCRALFIEGMHALCSALY